MPPLPRQISSHPTATNRVFLHRERISGNEDSCLVTHLGAIWELMASNGWGIMYDLINLSWWGRVLNGILFSNWSLGKFHPINIERSNTKGHQISSEISKKCGDNKHVTPETVCLLCYQYHSYFIEIVDPVRKSPIQIYWPYVWIDITCYHSKPDFILSAKNSNRFNKNSELSYQCILNRVTTK